MPEIPVIKSISSEEVRHPDGRIDVTIRVPLLKLAQVAKGGYEKAKEILIKKFNLTPEQAERKLQEALQREKELPK